ncbi:MAG: hypothetical protein ACJ790_17350 [Myxococcaceae bacterium]
MAQQTQSTPSQAQHFGPSAEYQKFMNEQVTRMHQMFEEFSKMQLQATAQATKAIDDGARLMKDSINYAQQLSEELRKLSLESSKKAADFFTPKA